MKLPNADEVIVERKKITDYLLSSSHPDGRRKSEFFAQFGFSAGNWEVLREALRFHALRHEVAKSVESVYGTRYAVDGPLESPDGRDPLVRTVWITDKGSTAPRLITAYPIQVIR